VCVTQREKESEIKSFKEKERDHILTENDDVEVEEDITDMQQKAQTTLKNVATVTLVMTCIFVGISLKTGTSSTSNLGFCNPGRVFLRAC